MLLKELTGVKSLKKITADEILLRMKKEGVSIKNGSFGAVLINPKWDYVIKVFPKDDCYLSFVEYAMEHPNPSFPKFKKKPSTIKAFFDQSHMYNKLDKFYAVKMEKLTPLSTSEERAIFGIRWVVEDAREAKNEQELTDIVKKAGYTKYKDLVKTFLALEEVTSVKDKKCALDIHHGNIMKRGSTYVVVDPFSAMSKADAKYLEEILIDIESLTQSVDPDAPVSFIDKLKTW